MHRRSKLTAGAKLGLACSLLAALPLAAGRKPKQPVQSPIAQYLSEAVRNAATQASRSGSPGSLYAQGSVDGNMLRDLRAFQQDDIVTIIVSDSASAVSKGVTSSSRKSAASASIGQLFGKPSAAGALSNLAGANGATTLDGQGSTSRENTVSTALSARVIAVAPNGNLIIEGLKSVRINSEQQTVRVRGIVRATDISPLNTVASNQLGMLEVDINGKGVVGDAIRRPFFLYRLLLGLLPF